MNKFEKNREKMANKLKENELFILFSGEAPIKRGDEYYPFSPDRNFYYFTGIEEENCIFLTIQTYQNIVTTLYIPRPNGVMAKWVGENITLDEAKEISKISEIKYIDQFEEDLGSLIFRNEVTNLYLDVERRGISDYFTKSLKFSATIKENYPSINIINSFPIISTFRVIKEAWEIQRVREAVDITEEGFLYMMKNAKPNMMEYEIEAYFDFILKSKGVSQKAFNTICASGERGCTLHYWKNNEKSNDGDLVLVDAGASFKWYAGDITRTFPVNGKFSPRQKEVYEIVLSAQEKVINAIAPNVLYSSLNELVKDHYFTELKKIGLIKTKEEVSNYYYHNIGHFLGAETHDVGKTIGTKLEKNMILTVEPGLYIKEWQIGIRIEDDVLVTENGCEVLTKKLPKTVLEIENYMSRS